MNIAINGFGRIGRQALHLILEKHPELNVVLINDPGDGATLAHLLEFDTNYGHFDCAASFQDGVLTVKGKKITVTQTKDPATLPHKEKKVDIVLECTGKFCKKEDASLHLKAGAKKVILSAPGKDEIDGTFVLGVNEGTYDSKKMHIISNASCTTNSLAPVAKVLDEAFGIEHGLMTTIHSYTNDQVILDVAHKDLRRARIFFASAGGREASEQTAQGFRSAAGFIKRHLGPRLGLRYMPELEFFYDDSFDHGARIDQLLKSISPSDHGPDRTEP